MYILSPKRGSQCFTEGVKSHSAQTFTYFELRTTSSRICTGFSQQVNIFIQWSVVKGLSNRVSNIIRRHIRVVDHMKFAAYMAFSFITFFMFFRFHFLSFFICLYILYAFVQFYKLCIFIVMFMYSYCYAYILLFLCTLCSVQYCFHCVVLCTVRV